MSDLGQALVEQFNGDRANSTDERLSHVRTVLARAWELNADDASISGLLGMMLLYQPHDPAHAREALEAAVRLAPSNDTYRLWLSDALIRTGNFERAKSYLGPLMARASTSQIQADARQLMARGVESQRRAGEPARPATAPGLSSSTAGASSSRSSTPLPATPSGTNPNTIYLLREPLDGEKRVIGQFSAVECRNGGVALVVDAPGGALRLQAAAFDRIEFISYRQDGPSSVACGAVAPALRVIATYRVGVGDAGAAAGTASGSTGAAVAIELLPDGYTPDLNAPAARR